MSDRWTAWTSLPAIDRGEYLQIPMGPGVYEVCHAGTRERVAYGCARDIGEALRNLVKPGGLRKWLWLRRDRRYAAGELEYRVWATATLADAKAVVALIRNRREAMLRRFTAARV
jgi:hypothetical protein